MVYSNKNSQNNIFKLFETIKNQPIYYEYKNRYEIRYKIKVNHLVSNVFIKNHNLKLFLGAKLNVIKVNFSNEFKNNLSNDFEIFERNITMSDIYRTIHSHFFIKKYHMSYILFVNESKNFHTSDWLNEENNSNILSVFIPQSFNRPPFKPPKRPLPPGIPPPPPFPPPTPPNQ